jgi:hypothetical protein
MEGKSMTNWKRMTMTGMLALATLGAPLAEARDRCDRPSYSRYENRGYGRSYAPAYAGYRNYDYRNNGYRNYDYRQERSAGKSAAIIGGSAAAGAVIGGLAGGGKGAAVGAVVGGIGGLVVDRTTRDQDRDRYGRRW